MGTGAWLRTAVTLLILLTLLAQVPVHADAAPASWLEVMPDADRLGPLEGTPQAAGAFAGDRLVGYVLSTRTVGGSRGYSGKPLDILVGLDLAGRITGAELIEQSEPIGATGRTASDLEAFVRAYAGRSVERPLAVVRQASGPNEVDAISGATVTSLVFNDTILGAARAVARARGLLGVPAAPAALAGFEPLTWAQLSAQGLVAVQRLTLADADGLLAARGGHVEPPGRPDDLFLEVVAALASAPRIGGNLVGIGALERIAAEFGADDSLLFVGASGRWSVKGTAWQRSGTFERLAVLQGERTFPLTAADHRRIERVMAEGAPELREAGLFGLRAGTGFRPDRPWRLQVLIEGIDATGAAVSAVTELPYQLPGAAEPAAAAAEAAGDAEPPLWQAVWLRRAVDIAVLAAALACLTAILFLQDQIAQRPKLWRSLRTGFLLFTLLWLGWYATAQLSVVNVLTFGEALRTGFRWEFFLLEPLIFILWSYVAVALVFWGRGAFCGWLCPFGAALALPARLRQFEWLKRHWQCGRECRICQVQCPVQAIQPEGSIHPGECIYCLKCQTNYHNDRLCPPMIERRKRRERRAAVGRGSGESIAAAATNRT